MLVFVASFSMLSFDVSELGELCFPILIGNSMKAKYAILS